MTSRWNLQRAGDSATDRMSADLLKQLVSQGAYSRRGLLRAAGVSALGVSGASLFASCGTDGAAIEAGGCTSKDLSAEEKTMNFSNWPAYMDESDDGKTFPTLAAFEKSSGIAVEYTADVNSNDDFFAKVKNQLTECQSTERDLFVLTDWMAARMIGLGWIQELERKNITNVDANLQDSLRDVAWDKGRKFSVPWQSGLTGIAYNAKFTDPVSSFEELTTRADLKGKISLLDELNDTMGFVVKMTGADPGNFTDDEWSAAIAKLEEIVDSGQVRRFTGNDYRGPLNKGDIVACEAWSGDILSLQFENPDVKFVVPEEGLALWSDNMMVPNKATHKANAEKLMDHYYDPEIAARLASWVNYICPVVGAQDEMKKIDKSLVDNELIFPTEETLTKTFGFMSSDTKRRAELEKDFKKVIGG
jgi:spermidine/putrescine transport system substrate-binding protein